MKRFLLSFVLMLFAGIPLFAQGPMFPGPGGNITAAVVYEAAAHTTFSYGTGGTYSITLGGASSNRAVLIAVNMAATSLTDITVTVGGQSAAFISGTDSGAFADRTVLYGLTTSLTGAQTVAVSWSGGSSTATSGAISATGVNQTTPFAHGIAAHTYISSGPISLTVTSVGGNLTATSIAVQSTGGTVTASTNESLKWTDAIPSNANAYGDVGPGTGTTTHTWTLSGSALTTNISGADFVHQ
jgi:hypothetical protein